MTEIEYKVVLEEQVLDAVKKFHFCIPHYFKEEEANARYGSCRKSSRQRRAMAVSRCIGSLLSLQKRSVDLRINFQTGNIEIIKCHREGGVATEILSEVSITICTSLDYIISEAIEPFKDKISIIKVDIEDPRQLPLAARDYLINCERTTVADFACYMEDDLVIVDQEFLHKQVLFHQFTDGHACLMPHRYERIDINDRGILYVDGPLKIEFVSKYYYPQKEYQSAIFPKYGEIHFDIPENPHSGFFCLSRRQVDMLKEESLPREGFVGPLETAATYTILKYFRVLKPSLRNLEFLSVEHAHNSHFMPQTT